MTFTAETEKRYELIRNAIRQMNEVFGEDFKLVQTAAAEHGVEATFGNLSRPLEEHNYNQRIPDQNELDKLLNAKNILIHCMDRRCSKKHAEDMQADVSISIAGGGAQPENSRETDPKKKKLRVETLANFLYVLHTLGNLDEIILSGHDGICGGINFLTQDKAAEANRKGPEEERTLVAHYLRQTAELLLEKGIPQNKIKMTIAIIGITKNTHGHDEESCIGNDNVPFSTAN